MSRIRTPRGKSRVSWSRSLRRHRRFMRVADIPRVTWNQRSRCWVLDNRVMNGAR